MGNTAVKPKTSATKKFPVEFQETLKYDYSYTSTKYGDLVGAEEFSPEMPKFHSILELITKRCGEDVQQITGLIDKISAVHTPKLFKNFSAYNEIGKGRMSSSVWNIIKVENPSEHQKKVQEFQNSLIIPDTPGLMMVLHGTGHLRSAKIAETGFCTLAQFGPDLFGKGMHFTTCPSYVVQYTLLEQEDPVIVVAWALTWPLFPVDVIDEAMDGGVKCGWHGHFAVTNKEGKSTGAASDFKEGNELVISCESQLFPVFLLHLNRERTKAFLAEWRPGVDFERKIE